MSHFQTMCRVTTVLIKLHYVLLQYTAKWCTRILHVYCVYRYSKIHCSSHNNFRFFFTDLVNPSRPASACSMVSALIVGDQGQQCPVCHCRYDSGKQRKLVDTNCGHARCFKCMFAVELCPLCHQNTIQPKHQSSRESGFQSFNGSVSSVYSMNNRGVQLTSTMPEEEVDYDRQSSTGSLLSLVSAQSALNMMAVPSASSIASNSRLSYYEPPNFSRVDQKRHSLSSLSRYQPQQQGPPSSISSRNSYFRRSAVISRSSRRMMSSIIEHQRKSIYQ